MKSNTREKTEHRAGGAVSKLALASMVVVAAAWGPNTSSAQTAASPDATSPAEYLSNTPVKKPEKDEALAAMLPKEIVDKGYLLVVSPVYPTAVMIPEDGGEPRGWEISTGEALGALLGIEFRFEVAPFEVMVPGLQAHRFDAAMGSIVINEPRIEILDWVSAHQTRQSLMVNAETDFRPESMLDTCGKTLGVLQGSVQIDMVPRFQEDCQKANLPEIDVRTFRAIAESMLALGAQRIDAQWASVDSNVYAATQHEGRFELTHEFDRATNIPYMPNGISESGIGLARHPYTPDLAKALAAAVNKIIEDGTQQAILDHWNGGKGRIAKSYAFVNGAAIITD